MSRARILKLAKGQSIAVRVRSGETMWFDHWQGKQSRMCGGNDCSACRILPRYRKIGFWGERADKELFFVQLAGEPEMPLFKCFDILLITKRADGTFKIEIEKPYTGGAEPETRVEETLAILQRIYKLPGTRENLNLEMLEAAAERWWLYELSRDEGGRA
jgi:hypothetical protein